MCFRANTEETPFSLNSTAPRGSVLIHQFPGTKMNNHVQSLSSTLTCNQCPEGSCCSTGCPAAAWEGTQRRMLGCFSCKYTGFFLFFFGLNSWSSVYNCGIASLVALCTDIWFQHAFVTLMWQIAIPCYNYHTHNKKYILLSHWGPWQRHNHIHWTLSKL